MKINFFTAQQVYISTGEVSEWGRAYMSRRRVWDLAKRGIRVVIIGSTAYIPA